MSQIYHGYCIVRSYLPGIRSSDSLHDRDIIREKASGKSLNREAYQTLRNQEIYVRGCYSLLIHCYF